MDIKVWKCRRCGWNWASRRGNPDKPITCPKCRSPYWDKEKQSGKDTRDCNSRTSPKD